MKCLPTTEVVAAFGSLLNEVALAPLPALPRPALCLPGTQRSKKDKPEQNVPIFLQVSQF